MILSLPARNRALLKYLFNFFHRVYENSPVNQMNEGNLAIVLGPNLFRRQDENALAALVDTPLILAVVRELVVKNSFFFE